MKRLLLVGVVCGLCWGCEPATETAPVTPSPNNSSTSTEPAQSGAVDDAGTQLVEGTGYTFELPKQWNSSVTGANASFASMNQDPKLSIRGTVTSTPANPALPMNRLLESQLKVFRNIGNLESEETTTWNGLNAVKLTNNVEIVDLSEKTMRILAHSETHFFNFSLSGTTEAFAEHESEIDQILNSFEAN